MARLALLTSLLIARAPEGVAALWFAGRRAVVDGRRIDPKAQALGELMNRVRIPGVVPKLADSRRSLQLLAQKFDLPSPPEVHKRDITLAGRPARIYDTQPDGANRPGLLYLHGGGWVQGDLETHDGLCGQIALEAGIRVIALDYRLAPEHKFPAGPDDCLKAFRALKADPAAFGLNPDRLAVGGDSAGGNLTAVLLHDLAEAGEALPKAQVLIYPAVDARMATRSMEALKDAYVLPRDRIGWYLDQYLPEGQDRNHPRVAPINSPHLAAQPPALILHAGHDPLWDDANLQAEALRRAGVAVTMLPYPGQVHAFLSARRAIPQARDAVSRISGWLKASL